MTRGQIGDKILLPDTFSKRVRNQVFLGCGKRFSRTKVCARDGTLSIQKGKNLVSQKVSDIEDKIPMKLTIKMRGV